MIYNLDSEIRVRNFGRISRSKGAWHNGQHSLNSTLLYCIQGTFDMSVENEIFHVEPTDILLIPPNMFFVPLNGGACEYYVVSFFATTVAESTSRSELNVTARIALNNGYSYSCKSEYTSNIKIQHFIKNTPSCVKNVFERADKLKPNESFSNQLLLDQLVKELLIHLSNENHPKQNHKLTGIMEYIEQNYFNPLSLSSISEKFSFSESYVARLFKKELNCKPSEYINNVRISVAIELLLTTEISVTEISDKVGYSDVYYFSKTFKRIVGCSPSKARSSNTASLLRKSQNLLNKVKRF